MRRNTGNPLVPLQVAAAVLTLVGLTMWPPSSGKMLLVPLANGDSNTVARAARAADALLVGTGPFPGSMVVLGDRARIEHQIASWDIIVLAAPPAGCGDDILGSSV